MRWFKRRRFKRLQILHIADGDTLVVRFSRRLTAEFQQHVLAELREMYPKNRVLLLDDSAELTVVRTGTGVSSQYQNWTQHANWTQPAHGVDET